MRSCCHSRAVRALVLAQLTLAAGGCSTKGDFQTSSIAPRPEMGMSQEPRRPEPPSTYSGPPLASNPDEQPATSPRPSAYGHAESRWREPAPAYASAHEPSYRPRSYDTPNEPQRWQPDPHAQARGAPITTGSLGSTKNHAIVVREGDTLYSLSKRHGVTIAELVKANRITDGKIRIGQSLVVPARH